jgi:hypothetical protein
MSSVPSSIHGQISVARLPRMSGGVSGSPRGRSEQEGDGGAGEEMCGHGMNSGSSSLTIPRSRGIAVAGIER